MKKCIVAVLILGIVISHFVLLDTQAKGITVNVSNEVLVNNKHREDIQKEIDRIKEEKQKEIEEYERVSKWNNEIKEYIQ